MIQNNRWTAEQDAMLTKLWEVDGLTSRQIADKMGLYSRQQAIGRAHRLGLTRRPNPTKASPLSRAKSRKRAQQFNFDFKAAKRIKETVPLQVPIARVIPIKLGPVTKCRWPEGDPKHPDFHFCEAPTLPGRSYCECHHARAYQPKIQAAE